MQRSDHGSSEADPGDHYDDLGNMEFNFSDGVLNRDADDKIACHSRMSYSPPAACNRVQKRRTEYITPSQ